jgi:hypothetical protein
MWISGIEKPKRIAVGETDGMTIGITIECRIRALHQFIGTGV